MAVVPLSKVLTALKKRYGKPKPHPAGRDPLGILVWEMVAYLGGAAVRDDVFKELRTQIGLDPQALLDASLDTLTELCRAGGPVAPLHRAKCIHICAAITMDEFGGDLSQVLKWEYAKAVKALRKFPSVAEPGADRILMICGSHPVLGMESNALRVLLRLGYGVEDKNYTKAYRSARNAAMAVLPKNAAVLAEASALLRTHGKETCKTSTPRCEECPVTAACAYFSVRRAPKRS
jgi:endonuclease III